MYLVGLFTRMSDERYRMRLKSLLLCLCAVFRALFNAFVCCFCPVLFQLLHVTYTRSGIATRFVCMYACVCSSVRLFAGVRACVYV